MPWDLFLMKKLMKSEICGSINSAQIHCSLRKVNIYGYCLCTVYWTVAAFLQKCVKKKKKNEKNENATSVNADAISAIQTSTKSFLFPTFLLFHHPTKQSLINGQNHVPCAQLTNKSIWELEQAFAQTYEELKMLSWVLLMFVWVAPNA